MRNVTEKSALGVTRRRRHFRHSTGIRQLCFGRGVDQPVGHDAAPLLHPPLQRAQVRPAESVRLLPERQGHPVILEEPAPAKTGVSQVLPEGSLVSRRSRLMCRWRRSQPPVPAPSAPWAGRRRGQRGGNEPPTWVPTVGSLNLVAQLADAVQHDAGVNDRHPHTPATARLPVSSRSLTFRSGAMRTVSSGASGALGSARSRTSV